METGKTASPPVAPAGPPGPNSRHHQRRKNRIKPEQVNINAALTVHVSGFPPYTQAADLIRTFSQYGSAKVEKINGRQSYAYLVFASEDEARAAAQASKKINVYGEFLLVRPYNIKTDSKPPPKQNFIQSKQKDTIVEPQKLDLSGDFHAQVDSVLAGVRLSQGEATRVAQLYQDLERVLQAQWPGCVVLPFGSITTGLGIKSSDADCFVQVAGRRPPGAALVARARQLLQAYPDIFAELLAIPKANTPILKFFHLPTRTNCDLSFKTPLGFQNSKLIAHLLHLDPRLVPVAIVIKYWAKVHGLSGTGRLTNYALTMMVIFYLQRPPLSILPAVESLQRDPTFDVIVDHWNAGFRAQESPALARNPTTISEILGGFFEFYSSFDFDKRVVCPFLGEPLEKQLFKNIQLLPAPFERYKRNVSSGTTPPLKFFSSICVQDPFELCHNVASAITVRMASDIKAYFKFAADAYEKEKTTGCQDFIKIILLQKPNIVRKKKGRMEFRMNLFTKLITEIKSPDWKSVVIESVFEVFENMLKIKLTQVKERVNPAKEKYRAVLTKAIWRRKKLSKMYDAMNMDFQTKQAKITDDVNQFEKYVFDCKFQMIISFVEHPRNAALTIRLTEGDIDAYNQFGNFFISDVRDWFSVILRNHSKPGTEMPATVEETIKLIDGDIDRDDLDSDDDDSSKQADSESSSEEDDVNVSLAEIETRHCDIVTQTH